MVFNSLTFFIFFAVFYLLYLSLQSRLKLQNLLLLIGSSIFYAWWDWRFLFLIYFTTIIDFFISQALCSGDYPKRRKLFLSLSIASNLSMLGFFKYFNFFKESFENFLGFFGVHAGYPILHIVLPIGISFYTFKSMSYVIDIYRRQIKPAEHLLDYATYVTFFPQLLAGPIERAGRLLPRILNPRHIKLEQFYEGGYLIFWGLFKKMFVADNLATIVDAVFSASPPYNGAQVLVGVYAFAFQIYCDFSGYTDIARGLGKMMGFDIMLNFNLPYFASNPRDFWRRWHISLSTWLRDYLYIPLGGNRSGKVLTYRNLIITMLLGGLWHGANWTFVFWGAYHGLLLCAYNLLKPFLDELPKIKNNLFKNLLSGIKIIFFFHLVCLGWLFFRAESFAQIVQMLNSFIQHFHIMDNIIGSMSANLCFYILILVIVQWFQYRKNDLMLIFRLSKPAKVIFYLVCFYSLMLYGVTGAKEFIYFQF